MAHTPLRFMSHLAHATPSAPAQAKRATKGATFDCISTCSAYESTINQFFTDVAAGSVAGATDNVYSVQTQYADGAPANIQYNQTFGGSYVDGNPYPTTNACQDGVDTYCVTNAQLTAQIGKVIAANNWPTFSTTTLYLIFTPANVGTCIYPGVAGGGNPCTSNVFCAYHAVSNAGFIYAVEPDALAVPGDVLHPHPCDSGEAPAGNSADATINTVSHEQIEATTDPFNDGWISADGAHNNPEIGDLCAYDFGTALGGSAGTLYNQTINGHNYYLQLEYSNAANSNAGGCVPYLGGPVTAADPRDGVGPLVYNGGALMTTNTVYAIYWIPAAPANTKLPTISGTAKVGKKLRASHGRWSNGPKFTYRWLRCSKTGTSCKGIAKATGSTHALVLADVGHKLEVRVTGTNMVKSVSANSAPTAVVKK